jgi:hypothetical protein
MRGEILAPRKSEDEIARTREDAKRIEEGRAGTSIGSWRCLNLEFGVGRKAFSSKCDQGGSSAMMPLIQSSIVEPPSRLLNPQPGLAKALAKAMAYLVSRR